MSSNGIASLLDDIKFEIYSYPLGVGSDPVILGKGNKLPESVNPKNAEYKSVELKLFWYNLTPMSLNT